MTRMPQRTVVGDIVFSVLLSIALLAFVAWAVTR